MEARRRYSSLYERLVANTREDDDGCWIWQGSTNGRYPVFTQREPGKPHPARRYAHRAMLEEWHGYYFPLDEAGHWRCYKPLCIRPDCLRIETQAENLSGRRGYAECKGRWIPILWPTERRELDDRLDEMLERAMAHWS